MARVGSRDARPAGRSRKKCNVAAVSCEKARPPTPLCGRNVCALRRALAVSWASRDAPCAGSLIRADLSDEAAPAAGPGVVAVPAGAQGVVRLHVHSHSPAPSAPVCRHCALARVEDAAGPPRTVSAFLLRQVAELRRACVAQCLDPAAPAAQISRTPALLTGARRSRLCLSD